MTEEITAPASLALETFLALPLAVWDALQDGLQAERVESFVAFVAVEKVSLLSSLRANLAELAVQTFPVPLVLAHIVLWQLEAVGVEGFTAEGARKEVLSVAEGPA